MTTPTNQIDVAYVARLARLDLTPEELDVFQKQLSQIVVYVREIESVDVAEVEPMAHAVQVQNVFRRDEAGASLERDTVLANAPRQDGEQFLVPKIV